MYRETVNGIPAAAAMPRSWRGRTPLGGAAPSATASATASAIPTGLPSSLEAKIPSPSLEVAASAIVPLESSIPA